MSQPPITRVFVYGTLMPGDVRWPQLAPFADPATPPSADSVDGVLWSTPWGWPALTGGGETVHGVVVALSPDRVDVALATTDAIEGVDDGLFERIEVTTHTGRQCWAYRWPSPTDGFDHLPEGRWSAH